MEYVWVVKAQNYWKGQDIRAQANTNEKSESSEAHVSLLLPNLRASWHGNHIDAHIVRDFFNQVKESKDITWRNPVTRSGPSGLVPWSILKLPKSVWRIWRRPGPARQLPVHRSMGNGLLQLLRLRYVRYAKTRDSSQAGLVFLPDTRRLKMDCEQLRTCGSRSAQAPSGQCPWSFWAGTEPGNPHVPYRAVPAAAVVSTSRSSHLNYS